MPHDLLVYYKIEVEEKFKDILKPTEAIRGELCKLTLYITNLGKEKFPGGTVKNVEVQYGLKGISRSSHSFGVTPVKCPEISPSKTKEIVTGEVIPLDDGLGRVVVKLEAKDKQPIKYYQTKKVIMEEDEWYNFFYVVGREQILEIMLLKQLLEGR